MTDQPGRAEQLGIIASIASEEVDNQNITPPQTYAEKRAKRFYLQSIARELLPKERVSECLMMTRGDPEVWYSQENKKAHYAKLITCGSKWHDPVCAYKISEQERNELRQAEKELAKEKIYYQTFMGTFTSAHSKRDKSELLVEYFNQAYRQLKSGRWWVEFEKDYGLVGNITGSEITYGRKNGWHFHKHVDFFCTRPKEDIYTQQIESDLAGKWSSILEKMGRFASEDVGVVCTDVFDTWSDYCAKWGIASEITKSYDKRSEHGFTPFELLELAGDGERWAGRRFKDYAKTMKGRNQLVYSRGLRHTLGMDVKRPDEELAEEVIEKGDILLAALSKEQWHIVLEHKARADLLKVADTGDAALVNYFLVGLGAGGEQFTDLAEHVEASWGSTAVPA